ncbi:cytochrome c oxidase subunit 6A2, mitochondrial-like [Anopheles bellator]|uniref:cytochrome c oxidase subunit 6A2, mitochondrial-like n=1 Tax=Anopheles bellator TaxID=139047 RepID=UPI002647BAC8|nr:cytochrome c oxidase subunit 6A2, mitochondrial-like [Anopheles bellator]
MAILWRKFAASQLGRAHFSAGPSAVSGHSASGGYKTWKNLTFFVALQTIGLCFLNVYLAHQEARGHHPRPEFVPYEHLRIRNKRFPWGDGNKTLFHNPEVNALPDGYEK